MTATSRDTLRAGDEGWDGAVMVWNGMVARFPGLVLQPTSAQDVAAAVRFARAYGHPDNLLGANQNIRPRE